MVEIKIDVEKCIGCGACINVCPVELFVLEDDKLKLKGNPEECVLCMACETSCPVGAIKIIK